MSAHAISAPTLMMEEPMKNLLIALTVGSLVGCYDEDTFAEDYATAICDNMASCETDAVDGYMELGLDEETAQTTFDDAYTMMCDTEAEESDGDDADSDCDFDKASAQTCVDEVEAMSCDFWTTGEGMPSACADVCG